ncbi:UNVERIFIED_ORG: DNA-binding transcriptional LysR family regulator [Lelliottia amnigena]|nr:DNA-binding transcriptional LysR family regulator [Lelliottia amnigena]
MVTTGSFARAADTLHRSQSSISYNLAQLQTQLGVTLLVPEGRRTVLTPTGATLLSQVRPLLKTFSYVEAQAATLQEGMRSQLNLVVDVIYPRERLFSALQQFQQRWPTIRVKLTEVTESMFPTMSTVDDADVMIVTDRQNITGRGEWLMNVDFIAVAHRDHPLLSVSGTLTEALLSNWPRIQIADSGKTASGDSQNWDFSTLDAAAGAIAAGLGYGWLPQASIHQQLAAGILQPLPLSHGSHRVTPLHIILRRDVPPDEPVSFLISALKKAL